MLFNAKALPESVIEVARQPRWDMGALRHRSCPVCQGDQPKELLMRPDGLIIHSCSICEMLYLAEVPSEKNISDFYSNYSDHKVMPSGKSGHLRRFLDYTINPFISILLNTGGIKDQHILEIGCSYGLFLELIKYGGGKSLRC